MRYSDFATMLALIACICWASKPSMVRADCMICDEVVTLDASRADCFLQNFDAIIEKLASSPSGRISVDLNACAIEGEALETRGGIATLPSMAASNSRTDERNTKSVYLLDTNGVTCLRELVQNYSGSLNPAAEFDLFEDCPK